MAIVNVAANVTALSENSPYSVVELIFNYEGTTVQNGTVIYYSAHLSDGTNSEDVVFPFTITAGTEIPATGNFAYTPGVTFISEINATEGKIYYTA
ncbi:hypothetical protein OXPF_42090 [Oxobacter pfennigii]|uniref:Uncharacterized protein n=1 Tax=Oxobacter pfennigii TaxID=36849 RepID=A0A0N8NSM2_9CLOT|nr:hypothetical protein [Oxobacter pfennigii]KPU42424.1 hypothetical protein OXPF_42090 [Oxobacter pfennigii]